MGGIHPSKSSLQDKNRHHNKRVTLCFKHSSLNTAQKRQNRPQQRKQRRTQAMNVNTQKQKMTRPMLDMKISVHNKVKVSILIHILKKNDKAIKATFHFYYQKLMIFLICQGTRPTLNERFSIIGKKNGGRSIMLSR